MRNIDVVEGAKMIRKVLKESFPNTKFSVRTERYSGGSSTDISWVDGPTAKQVDKLVSVFKGSYFDGMIDYKGSRYAMLDGEMVSFSGDFVFTKRNYSDAATQKAIDTLVRRYPNNIDQVLTVEEYKKGNYYNVTLTENGVFGYDSIQQHIGKIRSKHTFDGVAKESPTLARVTFAGDDGYGMGTAGMNGEGGSKGYPGGV